MPTVKGSMQVASLADKVAFLTALPSVVQVIETHMAYVFLTADQAFKLKKPVCFGYFDYRTVAARARACSEELRLNRALAGDVYLGTVPLVLTKAGLGVGGCGLIVDWLIQMRRLPAQRMLDRLITSKTASPLQAEIAGVLTYLARFYRQQQKTAPPTGLYLRHLHREQAINLENLHQTAQVLPDIPLVSVTNDLQHRIDEMAAEISAREAAGLVVEGHGDLRPEHVCLTDPPIIFDRVETALELRIIDVFDEVGYLAAECVLLGRPDLGHWLIQGLTNEGFAPPSAKLQVTYAMFRLVTRARLALVHLRDPSPATPEKWPVRAGQYLTEAIRLSGQVPGCTGS